MFVFPDIQFMKSSILIVWDCTLITSSVAFLHPGKAWWVRSQQLPDLLAQITQAQLLLQHKFFTSTSVTVTRLY